MSFIKEPEGYVDYHGSRAGALSDAGIADVLDDGSYRVPDDVVERGVVLSAEQEDNAKYKKKQYGQVKSLSVVPVKDNGFKIYDLTDADAPKLQGRIEQIERVNAQSDKRYMLVRDGDEQAHYVPLFRNSNLKVGSIVEVSAAGKDKGGADYNIDMIASNNEGVYRREDHLKFIEGSEKGKDIEDVGAYLDHHGTRLKTLEKAGVIEELGGGDYLIPKDIVERGDELNASMASSQNKKPHYAKVKTISAMPIESQIDAHARTFLDLEIHRHQKDYALSYADADKGTLEAISKRQDWLADNGYAYHKENTGEFVMKGDALGKLYNKELEWAGSTLAKRHGVQGYQDLGKAQGNRFYYSGRTDLMAGRHFIVEQNNMYSLLKAPLGITKMNMGEPFEIDVNERGKYEVKRFIREETKEEAIKLVTKNEGLSYMDVDMKDGEIHGTFVGALILKDHVYAVVSEGDNFSMFKTHEYPSFERGGEIILEQKNDGFVEIREADKQKELGLEIKEPEVEHEEQQLARNVPEIEIDDDWWD